jgi:hypothetical protein
MPTADAIDAHPRRKCRVGPEVLVVRRRRGDVVHAAAFTGICEREAPPLAVVDVSVYIGWPSVVAPQVAARRTQRHPPAVRLKAIAVAQRCGPTRCFFFGIHLGFSFSAFGSALASSRIGSTVDAEASTFTRDNAHRAHAGSPQSCVQQLMACASSSCA